MLERYAPGIQAVLEKGCLARRALALCEGEE